MDVEDPVKARKVGRKRVAQNPKKLAAQRAREARLGAIKEKKNKDLFQVDWSTFLDSNYRIFLDLECQNLISSKSLN